MVFIVLPNLRMCKGCMKFVSNVKEQPNPLQEDMRCPNNSCYIVRYLMFGVLNLSVLFLLLLGFRIFYLL